MFSPYTRPRALTAWAGFLVALSTAAAAPCVAGTVYLNTTLASDGVVPAPHIDSNLINPWGAAISPTGPIWVANQGSDNATLFDGAGNKQSLVVDIPFTVSPGAEHGPTGVVFNGSQSFQLNAGGKTGPASFLFANLDGSISAWNNTGDATKAVKVFSSPTPSGYTGLAIHNSSGASRLYAVDGTSGRIDVLDDSFKKVTTTGNFSDPSVPSGLFPFNISEISGKLYVTYAQLGENDDAAKGRGALAVFDLEGNLVKHLATGGELSTPWGLSMAPANFGDFSNKLLVGNFSSGFGQVNAFEPDTGKFLGIVSDKNGNPIRHPYQWA